MNTALLAGINWPAVGVAAAGYFALGGLWYSRALFGTPWMRLTGIDSSDPDINKGMAKMMIGTLLLTFIACSGLAVLVARMDLLVLPSALKLGFVTGICFATTGLAISFVYERRPPALYFINCGYHLFGHLIAAVILVLWR